MTVDKWIVAPGETRVIDVASARELKVSLAGGALDVIAHDAPDVRIEVHGVSGKDLRIESDGERIEIDHPQLRWDTLVSGLRSFGARGARAEISIAVPRSISLSAGAVSAEMLLVGLEDDVRVNTASGEVILDGLRGDLVVNSVSGDVHARGLHGALSANSVSGDVSATGTVLRADVDTVTGTVTIDTDGVPDAVSVNSVSGDALLRLDEDVTVNYVCRTVGGKVVIDGTVRTGDGPVSSSGSTGARDGRFLDIRMHSVSGDLTVVRRAPAAPDDGAAREEQGERV